MNPPCISPKLEEAQTIKRLDQSFPERFCTPEPPCRGTARRARWSNTIRQPLEGVPYDAVGVRHLVHREIALEHAAVRPELLDAVVHQRRQRRRQFLRPDRLRAREPIEAEAFLPHAAELDARRWGMPPRPRCRAANRPALRRHGWRKAPRAPARRCGSTRWSVPARRGRTRQALRVACGRASCPASNPSSPVHAHRHGMLAWPSRPGCRAAQAPGLHPNRRRGVCRESARSPPASPPAPARPDRPASDPHARRCRRRFSWGRACRCSLLSRASLM